MERRKKTRYTLQEPLDSSVQAVFTVKLVDLSLEGALLESDRPLSVGTGCEIKVEHEGLDFLVFGTVRNCRAADVEAGDKGQEALLYRVGLEFNERGRFAVTELLARVPAFVRKQIGTEGAAEGAEQAGDVTARLEGPADDRWRPNQEMSVSVRVGERETLEPHMLEMPGDVPNLLKPVRGRFPKAR